MKEVFVKFNINQAIKQKRKIQGFLGCETSSLNPLNSISPAIIKETQIKKTNQKSIIF